MEYSSYNRGKLRLKKGKDEAQPRHRKKRKSDKPSHKSAADSVPDPDAECHGGWWALGRFADIGSVLAIESDEPHRYWRAEDNGDIKLGPVRVAADKVSAEGNKGEAEGNKVETDEGSNVTSEGNKPIKDQYKIVAEETEEDRKDLELTNGGPSPEEQFTVIKIGENKLALKSGYGKFLSVTPHSVVTGRSEAIGSREQWEPVWEGEKGAILAANNNFASFNQRTGELEAKSNNVGSREFVTLRGDPSVPGTKGSKRSREELEEEGLVAGDLGECELAYVKRFQSFQDRRIRINPESRKFLEDAKKSGDLHELLLDRREMMKSDKFCK